MEDNLAAKGFDSSSHFKFLVYSTESVRDTFTLYTHLGICQDQRDLTALYHITVCLPSCNSEENILNYASVEDNLSVNVVVEACPALITSKNVSGFSCFMQID
ncbi:hypothetical protein LWI29_010002 [Acer saccharum]|uniref:Uncharacterized protein n=1 Tax=Acer saccharum TaxID=4024 RepID=A0AA39SGM0_ACESA|nr:hypothetical protein LWI29_010002 [Acer saccharum]